MTSLNDVAESAGVVGIHGFECVEAREEKTRIHTFDQACATVICTHYASEKKIKSATRRSLTKQKNSLRILFGWF
jgi:hypothetical protein